MTHDEDWKLKRLERLLPESLIELVKQVAQKEGGDPLMLLADLIRSAATARLNGAQTPSPPQDPARSDDDRRGSVALHQAYGYNLGVASANALAPIHENQLVLFQASEMTPEQAHALDGALARPDDVFEIEELALLPE